MNNLTWNMFQQLDGEIGEPWSFAGMIAQQKFERHALADATDRANRTASYGKKRKATSDAKDIDLDDINLDGVHMDATCNQVRGKIRRLLDSGEMTKTAFANEIGVSTKSLSDFLGRTGPMDGSGSSSYGNAWEWFKKRELAGIQMPTKKAKSTATSTSTSAKAPSAEVIDIRGIMLSGEAMDAIRIYDSCDEVRRKINAHLARPGLTQAQFCRDLEAQIHTRAQKVQSKQLSDFRAKKGPTAGNTTVVYYTAYVYFEKLRLAEGKPKSKHRLAMEDQWPTGVDTDRVRNKFLCPAGARPVQDRCGKVSMSYMR